MAFVSSQGIVRPTGAPMYNSVKMSGTETQCIKDFFAKYSKETTQINRNVYPNIQKRFGYIIDNLGQTDLISEILAFFQISSRITSDIILHPNTLKLIIDLKSHDNEIIDIVYDLHNDGYPVENYCKPLLSLSSSSEKYYAILDYLLKLKNADGSYYVSDDNVEIELNKLLDNILDKNNSDNKIQIDVIKQLVEEERNANVLTSIFVSKEKEWLLSLPDELIGYAISVFENHIEDYKDQQNVLILLASKGSSKGKKAVVRIATSKINDDTQRDRGIEIIKSFEHLNSSDSKPLISSLEFLKENNTEQAEIADECIKHLEAIKNRK